MFSQPERDAGGLPGHEGERRSSRRGVPAPGRDPALQLRPRVGGGCSAEAGPTAAIGRPPARSPLSPWSPLQAPPRMATLVGTAPHVGPGRAGRGQLFGGPGCLRTGWRTVVAGRGEPVTTGGGGEWPPFTFQGGGPGNGLSASPGGVACHAPSHRAPPSLGHAVGTGRATGMTHVGFGLFPAGALRGEAGSLLSPVPGTSERRASPAQPPSARGKVPGSLLPPHTAGHPALGPEAPRRGRCHVSGSEPKRLNGESRAHSGASSPRPWSEGTGWMARFPLGASAVGVHARPPARSWASVGSC